MAAGKKATKKKAVSAEEAERAALLKQAEQIPIKYDDVMTALSKADAARVLFVQVLDGSVFGEEDAGWIGMFAEEAFAEALEDAKIAYVKAVAAGTATNPKRVEEATPATEPAR
jgi:hypothetical protein